MRNKEYRRAFLSDLLHLFQALVLEVGVANSEYFIEYQDLRFQMS